MTGQAPQKRSSSADIIIGAKEVQWDKNKRKRKKRRKGGDGEEKEDKHRYRCNFHLKTKEQLEQSFKADNGVNLDFQGGLTDRDVESLRDKFGKNELTPPPRDPWWWRLLVNIFGGFFNQLLWVGSGLCLIAFLADPNDPKDPTNIYLCVVLSTVVTLTGCFGYVQEAKSADIMENFSKLMPPKVECYRNGKKGKVDSWALVPGDLVELIPGTKIPADMRIVKCSPDSEVDNASLTGESEPQKRNWATSEYDEDDFIEAKNMVYFGTYFMKGSGRAMVTHTGDKTFMGTIAAMTSHTEAEETPIAVEIEDFVIKVSVIAFGLGISFFIVGMLSNGSLIRNVIFLIGIIVANVPEGLLATITVSLTITAVRMREKNVQVKNLESVETLGSTSVICSDKTGTLTTSIMTVADVYFDMHSEPCNTADPNDGDFYITNYPDPTEFKPTFLRLVRIGSLCNWSGWVKDEKKGEVVSGQATEAAIFKFANSHIETRYRKRADAWRMSKEMEAYFEINFNSANKFAVTINPEKNENGVDCALVQVKGASERVLSMCNTVMIEGKIVEMTKARADKIKGEMSALSQKGERVLSFAERVLDPAIFDVTLPIPEPNQWPKYKRDDGVQGGILVKYISEEKETEQFSIPLGDLTQEDGSRFSGDLQVTIKAIKNYIFQQSEIQTACQYLWAGQTQDQINGNKLNEVLEDEMSLKDLGVAGGDVLYMKKGRFKFKGSTRDTCNFPIGQVDDQTGAMQLTFIGMMAMIDPPRPSVPGAVAKCQAAGIKVIMVTGDHPETAFAIAKKVGIVQPKYDEVRDANQQLISKKKRRDANGEVIYNQTKQEVATQLGKPIEEVTDDEFDAVVITGKELTYILGDSEISKEEITAFWNNTLKKADCVFARTSPEQKLRIVNAVRERGGIVAVTGDGVNDSPALKAAHIGVAMGITGTEVAKEAADMILRDDNFSSIVNGVEEGRIIFDNLKKSIAYTLSSNIPEILPFLLNQTVGIPLPLTTVMILLVDLGTDLAPAISMAHEGKEADIMVRPPRNPGVDKLVTMRLISFSYPQIGCMQSLAGVYAYLVVLNAWGLKWNYLPTLDTYLLFDANGAIGRQNDGYFLYCLKPESELKASDGPSIQKMINGHKRSNDYCVYMPEYGRCDKYATGKSGTNCRDNLDQWVTEAIGGKYEESKVRGLAASPPKGWWHEEWSTPYRESFDVLVGCSNITGSDPDPQIGKKWNQVFSGENLPCPREWEAYYTALWKQRAKMTGGYMKRPVNRYDQRLQWRNGGIEADRVYVYVPRSVHIVSDPQLSDKAKKEDWIAYCAKPTKDGQACESSSDDFTLQATGHNGHTWPMTMSDRADILARSNTAYFISIIIVQWADLMICKTRFLSLFSQGMSNIFMNWALLFETALGGFLVYSPVANTVTGTRGIQFLWWLPAVPFAIWIYTYDECRKWWIRTYRYGWVENTTYW